MKIREKIFTDSGIPAPVAVWEPSPAPAWEGSPCRDKDGTICRPTKQPLLADICIWEAKFKLNVKKIFIGAINQPGLHESIREVLDHVVNITVRWRSIKASIMHHSSKAILQI